MSEEKIIRNKKIYSIWKKGKKGYKILAKEFGLDWTTVGYIIRRYERLSGKK